MAQIPAALRPRIERVSQAFDTVLEALCDELSTPQASLPNGLRATITPTPALTAIDLDDPSPDQRRQMDGFAANRHGFVALSREIRLRNLSGAILIDPAGVPLRKRPALGAFLATALADDPMQPECSERRPWVCWKSSAPEDVHLCMKHFPAPAGAGFLL
ncbi:ribonuclease E/G [Asaia prunellae]|uniref:ribonuclease E/G n=1 Tax=Asaia prunellae TaxID=610245 RepID=UPI000B2286D4|nr:ribonuclease E/G [Asaia prunellae]